MVVEKDLEEDNNVFSVYSQTNQEEQHAVARKGKGYEAPSEMLNAKDFEPAFVDLSNR